MAEDRTPIMDESATTSQSNMTVTSDNESMVRKALAKFVESVVEEWERKFEKYEIVAKPGGRTVLSESWNLGKYAGEILSAAVGGAVALGEGRDYGKAASQMGKLGGIFVDKYITVFKGAGQRGKTKLVKFALGKYNLDTMKLRRLICEAAGRIFQAFEYQIMEINKKDDRVYQKLAHAVIIRFLWSLTKCKESVKNDEDLVRNLSIGAVYENSDDKGCEIESEHKSAWHAGSMLSKSGVYYGSQFYANEKSKTSKYGYRLPLKDEGLDLYKHVESPVHFNYSYVLTADLLEQLIPEIYDRINEQDPIVALQKTKEDAAEISSNATKTQEDLKAIGDLLNKCCSDYDYKNNRLETANELIRSSLGKTELVNTSFEKLGEHLDKSTSYIEAIEQNHQIVYSSLTNFSETTVSEMLKQVEIIEEALISKSVFCIGQPTENFCGRAAELEKIKTHFDAGGRCVIVSGDEGIGKTELAKKFAADNFNKEMLNGLWFEAHDIISLKDSLYLRAKEMNVSLYKLNEHDEQERSVQEIAGDIYRRTENRRTLLVFNGVHNYTILRKVLPWHLVPDMENIYVLIITREASLITEREIQVSLTELKTFEEGEEYVKSSLGNCAMQREIIALCRLLSYSPLALSLAVGYLKSTDCKIRNFVRQLKDSKGTKEWILEDVIRETVQIALSAIKKDRNIGCKALDLLKIMACMSSEFMLSDKFFNDFVDNQNQLMEALNLLEKFALIRLDGNTVKVHRLVHRRLQECLSETNETESYLETVLDIRYLWNYKNLSERLVPASNAVKFLELACNFEKVTLNFFRRNEDISLQENKDISRLVLEYLAECDLHFVVGKIFEHLKNQSDLFRIYKKHTLEKAIKLESVNVIKSLEPDDLKWIYFVKVLRAWKLGQTDALRSFLDAMDTDRYGFINKPMENLPYYLLEKVNFYTDDIRNEVSGRTPLILAISQRNTKLLELLVEAGADVTVTCERIGEKRKSALHFAVEKNLPEVVRYLLEKGCILEDDETYPFHIAAEKGFEEIVDIFLDRSRNCNLKNNIGQTPLHFAAMSGHLRIVQNLTNQGADVNVCDENGHPAIYFAMLHGKNDVQDYLEKRHDPADLLV